MSHIGPSTYNYQQHWTVQGFWRYPWGDTTNAHTQGGRRIDGDSASVATEVQGLVGCADVPKESGVVEDVNYGLIFQKNVQRGYGTVVLMEIFGTPSIGDTPFSLSRCG